MSDCGEQHASPSEERKRGTVKFLFMGLIRLYQLTISPLLGPRCRFHPSCSRYAYEAFEAHGAVRGGWLSARRLLRCHPWNPGGIDEVPAPRATAKSKERARGTSSQPTLSQGRRDPRLFSAQNHQGGCG